MIRVPGPARGLPAILLLASALAAAASAPPRARRPAPAHPKPAAESAVLAGLAAKPHARAADSLARLGFRPLSLEAYGAAERPLFASAWARLPDRPAPSLRHGIPAESFADSLSAWSARGLRPALLAAHPGGSAIAVSLVEDSLPGMALAGLDEEGFRKACDSAQRAGYRPSWVDAYAADGKVRYAAAFVGAGRALPGAPWNYSLGDDARSLEQKAAAFAPTWVRPALVAASPGGRLLTVWEEGSAGAWSLSPSVPFDSLRDTLRALESRGLSPVSVTAASPRPAAAPGSLPNAPEAAETAGEPDGSEGRPAAFVVLAAARAEALPREWTVTGPDAPGLEAFDAWMRRLMQSHGVRAGSLAMAKDGRLVFARGYTWAEEGYPVTAPNSLFRVASCSKPLTSMAIHRLLKEGGRADGPLTLKEKVLALVGPAAGSAPIDARFADITVDDLLSHSAGWVRSKETPDPVFNDWPAGSANRRRLPALAKDFLSYMMGQPLQFSPGSSSSYANFGYFLLGRILETLPHGLGRSYEEDMGALLFKPLGLTRPRFGSSAIAERAPGEVLYHTRYPYLQRNRDGRGGPWVPGAYGDFDLRNMEAAGAWILSAPDYAKVLASFDLGAANPVLPPEAVGTMWSPPHDRRFLRGWFATRLKPGPRGGDGEGAVAKWHNGLFPGTSALVFYRPDKWSFALFLNRDLSPQLTGDKEGRELGRLADAVEEWPREDLFPAMGIASFGPERWAGGSETASDRPHYSTGTP